MLQTDEIKFIEEKIKETIASVSRGHFEYDMRQEAGYDEEYPGWTESWLQRRIRDLHTLIMAYLEARQMPHLLEIFKTKFAAKIEDEKAILETVLLHPEGDNVLAILQEFKNFLEPFKFFDYHPVMEDETKKLRKVLQNTGFIITNSNAEINNEADIYKQVRWVLQLYYPSCRPGNKAFFSQQFKNYNPDILIPELRTAIEYKYLKTKKDNIEEFLDQIRVDSVNYKGDHLYDTFIAVIFIEDISVATPQSIEIAWKSKGFPSNWSLVITGNSIA